MKKTLLTILALVVLVTVVAAKHKKHKAAGKEILSITMKRGACYGRCPIFNIDIAKGGMVKYTGVRFVKDSGVFEKNVGAAKVKQLFDQFNAYRVDTCSKVYLNRVSDLSGTYYTIVYKDKTQTIGNANFGPDFLKTLTQSVINMATVDDTWKKINVDSAK